MEAAGVAPHEVGLQVMGHWPIFIFSPMWAWLRDGKTMYSALVELLTPAIESMGYEAVDIEFTGSGKGATLRVYIDKDGGITLDDCERVSHQVSGILDVEDPIAGHYVLEVSSPGLDRPLKKLADFQRFSGARIKLQLGTGQQGRRRFTGRLLAAIEDQVVLDVDGEEKKFDLQDIESARLVPEFNKIGKGGRA